MSENMEFTSPSHGRIYARSSRALSLSEPGARPQPPYPASRQLSASIAPYSADWRFPTIRSSSVLSQVAPLSNFVRDEVQSTHFNFVKLRNEPGSPRLLYDARAHFLVNQTPSAFSFHAERAAASFPLPPSTESVPYHSEIPRLVRRSPTASLRQRASVNSPALSYVTAPPIAAPTARAPIPDMNMNIRSFTNSPAVSQQTSFVDFPLLPQHALGFDPPDYTSPLRPDHNNLLLRPPSRAPSTRLHFPRDNTPSRGPSVRLLTPHQSFHAPSPSFHAPSPSFHAPSRSFHVPSRSSHSNFARSPIPHNYNVHNPPPQVPYHAPPAKPPTLPSTKDIPKLTGKSGWGPWNTAITTLITNQQVFGHISDGLDPGAQYDPTFIPTYPPIIHPNSPQQEMDEFSHWWSMDGIASHILCSTIDPSILNSIPIPNARLGERRNARGIYIYLRQHYGSGDYNSVIDLESKLRALACGVAGGVTVTEYITTYRLLTNEMGSAGYPMAPRQLLQLFADGLPNSATFTNLRQSIYLSLNESPDHLLPAIETVYDRTKIIENTSQRLRARRNEPKSRANTSSNVTQTNLTTSTTDQKSKPTCGNCGGLHPTKNCFQAGGAMEGKRDEVLAAAKAARMAQAHVAAADVDLEPNITDTDDFEITDLTSNSLAALCITRPTSTESIEYSSYALSAITEPTELPITKASLTALKITQNSALDSACTQHIIRDRQLFWTYDPAGAKPVGTANCGTLETLAVGNVKLRLTIDSGDGININVNWTLRNCLHAPTVPINLISVGTLTQAKMSVHFDPEDRTTILFPNDPEKLGRLAGKSFQAKVRGKISFLDCNFASPPTTPSIEPIYAFPVFPPTVLNPELWHRRLGHPGIELTRDMLTKDYVTGITWTGSFEQSHCIPCLIGKSPQAPYSSNKKRAENICDLIHIDTCGPYPVETRKKEKYFMAMLDDNSNYAACPLLVLKSGACIAWRKEKNRWENLSGNRVKSIRCDNAKEFIEGKMRKDLDDAGITIQATAPYAHSQNGKAERYIRTISDTAQALLADSKLPMSFWGFAVQTAVYLRNRFPTKTLSDHITPHEKMTKEKPDLSNIRLFGSQCFVHQPEEIRGKGAARRFEAIFIGYTENRIGWLVCDLNGKIFFSRDVIFNESVPGHLSPARGRTLPLLSPSIDPTRPIKNDRILRSQSNPMSLIAKVISERDERLANTTITLHPQQTYDSISAFIAYNELNTFLTSSPQPTDFAMLTFNNYCLAATSSNHPLRFRLQDYNPNKAPDSYNEAILRPDKDIWIAAMKREKASLEHRGAFERVTPIPKDRKPIGVRWTYSFKYHEDGSIRRGDEKARLVAQGFSQREGIDFGETYAPVVKLTSIRILLAYANHHNYEIMSFDVKTAFLHAKLDYLLFVKQIPGFPEADPQTVLRLLVALYGLRQSAYEFYLFLLKLLIRLGLVRCEVDHSVFIRRWTSPPHSSIPMLSSGEPLILIVPVHVDDGLVITNSIPLYNWFINQLTPDLEIVDMGPVSMYLGNRITRDRANRKLWISQKPLLIELLQTWNMLDCTTTPIPLSQPLHKLSPAPANSLPGINDEEITINYQRLVGSLTYLAICTRPDIAYTAMSLGQYNASPTRTHLLAAKVVLRYLAGTIEYGLEYTAPTSTIPDTVAPFIQGCALTDADWASDELDRKSVSGYCYYFHGCLVSWSAQKQKVVASSSTEAEYYSLSYALREGLWIRLLLTSLQIPFPTPFPLLCDNQSAIKLANTNVNSPRSKHIDVRYHFIREKIEDGTFETSWIPTADMTADIFTKPLPLPAFSKHRLALGIVLIP